MTINKSQGQTFNIVYLLNPEKRIKWRKKDERSKQPEGLLVKVGQNKMYAHVLEKLQEAFTAEVEKAVEGVGEVRKEEWQWILKIQDIDLEATVDKVRMSIGKALGNQDDSRKVTLLKPNMSGLRIAVVMLAKGQADELLRIGHVRGPCKLQDQKESEGSAVPQMSSISARTRIDQTFASSAGELTTVLHNARPNQVASSTKSLVRKRTAVNTWLDRAAAACSGVPWIWRKKGKNDGKR
ncbi:hypothetical protein TSAR_009214 [Trichomalopsis sarcophagae]|uniref:Uncharacterized protein n=1 Tax=Trichomalopsis sarcophagae TaxID=543379 RepID=A0A232EE51_9HYME|nr:hypothetical protein TSAR_009214 [Trichomalopsis sarcophagae]